MLPTWIFLVCVAAAWWGLKQPARMLAVFMVACVFGASAALHVVLLGWAPVTPALFFVPFLVFAALKLQGVRGVLAGASLREPGGWLLMFVGWAVFTAVFMPRLFKGDFLVFVTSRRSAGGGGIEQLPLAPETTNITQSIYLVTGLLIFLAARALAAHRSGAPWIAKGIVAAAAVNIACAVVDVASFYARTDLGLSLVRNTAYAVVSQSVAGWPRLQGAFAEPASMASFSAAMLGLLLATWSTRPQYRWSGWLVLATAAVLLLTLSSTAFLTFVGLLAVFGMVAATRLLALRDRLRFGMHAAIALAAVAIVCIVVLWNPPWLVRFVDIASVMVLDKAQSASGIERLAWTMGTWQNFLDSYGLGAGAGSARGSSYPLVILGNTGVIGGVLMAAVLIRLMLARTGGALGGGCKMGLVGLLIALSLTGTMIDPGPLFFLLCGLLAGAASAASTAADGSCVQDEPLAVAAGGRAPAAARGAS